MTEFDRTLGRLGSRIAASRGWALALALGITALACLALPSLRVDNSNEGTFGADDPVVVDYRAFKATFGNDEVVIVALEVPGKDALDPEFLVALGDLENELGALAHVRRTTSLRSVEVVEADETTINIHPFLDRLPPPAGARDVALSHPRIAGCLLSADGAVTAIVLDTDVADEDNVGKLTLVREAREILARPRFAAFAPRLVGAPVFEADFDERTSREGALFFLLAGLVAVAFLFTAFRRVRAAVIPLLVAVLAALVTLGCMAASGAPVSMFTVILPALLISVGVADAVHLVEGVLRQGVSAAYEEHGRACLITGLTTAAGFAAFGLSDVRPLRVLGLFAALGVLLCLGFSFLLAPWAAGSSREPAAPSPKSGFVFGKLEKLAGWSVKNNGRVLLAAAVLTVFAVVGLSRLRIDTTWVDAFKSGSPEREQFEFVDRELAGSFTLDVVVVGDGPDALQDPGLLSRIAAFEESVRTEPLVGHVYGPSDLVEEIHAAVTFGEDAGRLPDSKDLAAQELLLFHVDGDVFNLDYSQGRVQVFLRSASSSEYLALIERVEATASRHGLTVKTTGITKLFSTLANYLTTSQVQGASLAAITIALLLAFLLRSARLGLLALVPNVLPIMVVLGFMGFAGVPLDNVTVLVASVALGICDDDTVHFFTHFQRNRAEGMNPAEAARRTATALLRPAGLMTIALVAGFLVFCASSTAHLVRFGLLTALTIGFAYACEIVLTPALLAWAGGWAQKADEPVVDSGAASADAAARARATREDLSPAGGIR